MTLLDRYLAWHSVRASLAVLAVLLVLFGFITLVDELDDVGTGSYTSADAVAVTLLTTPRRAVELLPVSVLLGVVLGIGGLANHRELMAMRAAGRSARRLTRGPCIVAAAWVVVVVLAQNVLVPAAEFEAREFRSRTLAQTAVGGAAFWSRSANEIVRIGGVDFGLVPRDIEIYELGERARLRRLVYADRAQVLGEHEWRLLDVVEKRPGEASVAERDYAVLPWRSFLTADQMSTLIAPPESLSALDLYRYLEQADRSVSTWRYESMFWRQLSVPLAVLAMTLLGLPFVLSAVQPRSSGYRIVIGGVVGITYYLVEQVAAYAATVVELPPAPAALAPATVVLALALLAFRRAG